MKPYFEEDGITIYHGDCLSVIGSIIADGSVDVILTDPPYSSGARQSAQMRSRGSMRRDSGQHGSDRWFGTDNLTSHGFAMLVRLIGVESFRICRDGAHLFSFIDWRQWPVLAGAIESSGWNLRSCLVWDKDSFGMGNGFRQQAEFILHGSKGVADNFIRHDQGTVLRYRRSDEADHPTIKPSQLLERILRCVPGSLLVDPFSGSGSSLVAAKSMGWRAIGIEIEEKYCEIAANRLSQGVLPLAAA